MIRAFSRSARTLGLGLVLTLGSASAWAAASPIFPVAGSHTAVLSAASWQMVRDAPDGFVLGHPKALRLTVFLDPNCSVCHRFYEELQPLIRAGKVSVRVLPVGVIKPTSLGKSAHIELPFFDPALHQTPAHLLAVNEGGFQKGDVGGHISPVKNPGAMSVVKEHNMVLERLTALYAGFPRGRLETPVVIFTKAGQNQVIFGAPPKGAAALVRDISRPDG